MNRRTFLQGLAVGASGLSVSASAGQTDPARTPTPYRGPNVIIVRFGGGVRRRETIAGDETYSPFLTKVLAPQGVLFPRMEIDSGYPTSHGEGTLNILTGKYEKYQDVQKQFLRSRFEASVPTLFEAFRKRFDIPPHQALIVNGEDRIDEEFYSFSNHHLFGVNYRCTTLSLYRFKVWVLRVDIARGRYQGQELDQKRRELAQLEKLDHRTRDVDSTTPELDRFWSDWAGYYGKSGLVNPRGDRLLAELAVTAMAKLQPRLMMINFQDPDYVHWGNPLFYTRGVAIVDQGLRRIHEAVQADPAYRDRTVLVVVPDCGRDSNRFMSVPYQHHFNSKSAREIFAVVAGPGIDRGRVVDKRVEQCSIAATVAGLMDFPMRFAEGPALEEAFA